MQYAESNVILHWQMVNVFYDILNFKKIHVLNVFVFSAHFFLRIYSYNLS